VRTAFWLSYLSTLIQLYGAAQMGKRARQSQIPSSAWVCETPSSKGHVRTPPTALRWSPDSATSDSHGGVNERIHVSDCAHVIPSHHPPHPDRMTFLERFRCTPHVHVGSTDPRQKTRTASAEGLSPTAEITRAMGALSVKRGRCSASSEDRWLM
jgi:hypothetical protein